MIMRFVQRLGVVGLLGVVLLGASAWAWRAWLPQQRAQIDQLGSQTRRMRHELQAHLVGAGHPAKQAISSPEQAWQNLWQALPLSDQRLSLQAAVLSSAKSQGLAVNAVQYQGQRMAWASHEGEVLWRQRMVMPVEGGYLAVRAWLAQLLTEPALSVDQLDLLRTDVMSDRVKVRVAVSLWWRKTDGARP